MNNYVSIAYRQDKKPMGLYVFEAENGDEARDEAIDGLPPQNILTVSGCTEVWLVTRILTLESWPNCHREGCTLKACLKLNTPFCYPHHVAIAKGEIEP